ncbi:MAG: pyridoxal-phosphate dependent enzyme, partial [Alphaproteobacteria bacterium]|nr:pyridoxal-phosphate dependent enzyme [Alphaproteobacteria bacterium]
REVKQQIIEQENKLPDVLVACVGGGSNAIGLFRPFLNNKEIKMIGVEAAGKGLETGLHSAPLNDGSAGILHGSRTYIMQDDDGQIKNAHSISAGLNYPGIGAEHSWLKDIERAEYVAVKDDEALKTFSEVTRLEGILPALESCHAVSHAMKIAKNMTSDKIIVVNLSGRGDKDVDTVAKFMGVDL